MRMARFLLVALLVAGFGLAACADDDESSSDKANAELCDALGDLQADITGLAELGLNASRDEISDQWDEIKESFDEVIDAAADVRDAETTDLQSAFDGLKTAVEDLGDDLTSANALDALNAAATTFQTAWDAFSSAVTC